MPYEPPLNPRSTSEPEAFQPGHPAPHIAPIQTGSPLQRVLPWILSAAAVLGLMLVMLFVVLPRVSQAPHHSRPSGPSDPAAALPSTDLDTPPPPSVPPPATAAPTAGTSLPLAVTLYSAGSGKHVPLGKPVLISAYASLPPAGSATIAISYTRNGGSRSLLTLAQGSLSTASWTPALPGRYDFTASALDSRKISAFSRHIAIDVDAAVRSLAAATSPAQPGRVAGPALRAAEPAAHRVTARIFSPQPTAPKHPVLQHPVLPASRLKPYHVAAAQFIVRPIAETLAGALRRRGFHAFVRVVTQPHHKPAYVVETGKFLRPADAKKQLYTLNHDGYPAFIAR